MSAAYRPGPDAGVTVSDDGRTVYLAHLPGGPLLVLEGTAALIWVEATTEPAAGWVARVAEDVGRPEADIAADVEAFVADLQARRLLVTEGDTGATPSPSAADRADEADRADR